MCTNICMVGYLTMPRMQEMTTHFPGLPVDSHSWFRIFLSFWIVVRIAISKYLTRITVFLYFWQFTKYQKLGGYTITIITFHMLVGPGTLVQVLQISGSQIFIFRSKTLLAQKAIFLAISVSIEKMIISPSTQKVMESTAKN